MHRSEDMTQITTTTQLSLFTILRDIILTNATLTTKFNKSDFYQFEPKHKSGSTRFPYFIISAPTTDTEFLTMEHSDTDKTFDVEIVLKMDYVAREKFLTYANALIAVLEGATTTLEASGYFNHVINLGTSPTTTIENQKELVIGSFIFTCSGFVNR